MGTPSSHPWIWSPMEKLSELYSWWVFMEASSYYYQLLAQSPAPLPSWRQGWGCKLQASNHDLICLVTNLLPGTHRVTLLEPEMLLSSRNPKGFRSSGKMPSCSGNYKDFKDSVSSTGVKDRLLEQKMLLAALPPRRMQCSLEFFAWYHGQRPSYYSFIHTGI